MNNQESEIGFTIKSESEIQQERESDEDLLKYWDDAFDVEFTEEESISFSDRFPKPSYFES